MQKQEQKKELKKFVVRDAETVKTTAAEYPIWTCWPWPWPGDIL